MSKAHILRLIVTRTNVLISASNQNISRRRDAIDATASPWTASARWHGSFDAPARRRSRQVPLGELDVDVLEDFGGPRARGRATDLRI